MPDLIRMYRGWAKAQPTHRLVAAFLGVKSEDSPVQVDPGPEFKAMVERARKAKPSG